MFRRAVHLSVAWSVAAWVILPATTRAEDAREVKPIATAKDNSASGSIGPFQLRKHGVVVRSAEELVALTGQAKAAKDPAVQREVEAELARLLKVESIDWGKQMVLGVIGSGFDSLKAEGKVLIATYVPFKEPLQLAIPPTPKVLVLTERFEGDVRFAQKK